MLKDRLVLYNTCMEQSIWISDIGNRFTGLRTSCIVRLPGSGCAVHGPDRRGDGSRTSVHPGTQGRPVGSVQPGTKHHGIIRRVGVPGAFFLSAFISVFQDNLIRTFLFSRGKFPGVSLTTSLGAW